MGDSILEDISSWIDDLAATYIKVYKATHPTDDNIPTETVTTIQIPWTTIIFGIVALYAIKKLA